MSERRAETRLGSDAVATMLQAANLPVDEDRLDAIAELLVAADGAASHLDDAAARTSLDDALATFDPAWREGQR